MMKKPFTAQDILSMAFLAEPSLSPRGDAAYTAYKAADDGKSYKSLVFAGAPEKVEALSEQGNDKMPAFSPDGRLLAYLSDRSGSWQIWLRNLESGEDRQLSHARHGVGRFAWSPLGTEIAFEAAWWKSDLEAGLHFVTMTAQESEQHRRRLDMAPKVIEQINYKRDEVFGVFDGSDSYICAVNVADGAHRIICGGDMPVCRMSYSPDGGQLVFLGRPHEGPLNARFELFTCNADGSELRRRSKESFVLGDGSPCFSGDGEYIFCQSAVGENGCMIYNISRISMTDGAEELMLPLEDNGVCAGGWCVPVNRSTLYAPDRLFAVRGEELYFLSSRSGRELLCKMPCRGGDIVPVVSGDFCVSAFDVSAASGVLCCQGSPEHITDIRLYAEGGGCIVSHNNDDLGGLALARTSEHRLESTDGAARIQYWVSLPDGEHPERSLPVVLYIHGGPTAAVVHDFWHETQVLCSAGFAVVSCNPRGSFGYGLGFAGDAQAWGQEAVDDLLSVLDEACRLYPCMDAGRAGVTGGSYGGYMTVKLVSRTKRFRAAVAQRPLCNTATSYGTGDMGFYSASQDPATINIGSMLRDRAKKSLITQVDNIDTPMLILHGFKDYRCGYEQAEQLFLAIKDRRPDVPVRLVMFPLGNHSVSKNNRPCDMVRHVEETAAWFKKYLEVDAHD